MTRRTLVPLAAAALFGLGFAAAALGQYGDPEDTTTAQTTADTTATTETTTGQGSGSKPKVYRTTLSVGAEVPKPNAPAKASAVFSATVSGKSGARSLRWTLTFRNLSGKAIGAHVHRGRVGVAGPVLIPLCGPCKTGQTGRIAIRNDVADVLERGRAYVNVHTTKNQAGEVRGQLRLVSDDD